LNLADSTEAVSDLWIGLDQAACTTSKKPGCSGQKFSKRKIFDLGMEVSIETLQGMWSEVVLARGSARVFGKAFVQLTEVKN